MYLLNPGPVTLTSRVRNSLLSEDLCHREPEFSAMQAEIRERLVRVYPKYSKEYSAVLVTGSGTSAVEMMVGSLVPKNGKALVVANGVYGERMASMLKAQSKSYELIQGNWLEEINLNETENLLKKHADITHVLSVHHETTTGRLNNIAALGALCKKYSKPMLLDAVSSFGAEELQLSEWNIEAVAATANKCLHGVPGVSFVIAQTETLETFSTGATSIYLDLKLQYNEQKKGSSPFTHSVQCCYGLREALREFEDLGGQKKRLELYSSRSKTIIQSLKEMGVETLLSDSNTYSSCLVSFKMPAGKSYIALHDELKSKGFIIYAGQGKFNGEIFRVAFMGDLNESVIQNLIGHFRNFFGKKT